MRGPYGKLGKLEKFCPMLSAEPSPLKDRILDSINFLMRLDSRFVDPEIKEKIDLIQAPPTVVFVGLVSRGKSTLLNRLIGSEVLPVGPNPVTFTIGMLESGEEHAEGRTRDSTVSLPSNPARFRDVVARGSNDELEQFLFRGTLRIPEGSRLVDSPGVSEVGTGIENLSKELATTWEGLGVVGAVFVASVPPGASSDDIELFRELQGHFGERAVLALKATDSSVDVGDLEEAASVWARHGIDAIIVPDRLPDLGDPWGSGPLAMLEKEISSIWGAHSIVCGESLRLLESWVVQESSRLSDESALYRSWLSNKMELPQPTLDQLWEGAESGRFLGCINESCKTALKKYFNSKFETISSIKELGMSLRYKAVVPDHKRLIGERAFRPNSAVRKNQSLSSIVRTLIAEGCEDYLCLISICSASELCEIDSLMKIQEASLAQLILKQVRPAIVDFLRTQSESEILRLLELCSEALARVVIAELVAMWGRSLVLHSRDTPAPIMLSWTVAKNRFDVFDGHDLHGTEILDLVSELEVASQRVGLISEKGGKSAESDYGIYRLELAKFIRIDEILQRLLRLQRRLEPEVQKRVRRLSDEVGINSVRRREFSSAMDLALVQEVWTPRAALAYNRTALAAGLIAVVSMSFGFGFAAFMLVVVAFSIASSRMIDRGGILELARSFTHSSVSSLRALIWRLTVIHLLVLILGVFAGLAVSSLA